ncbi:hypothetical protein N9R04_06260 [Staphylococcus sp. SQ8-PEA]|uniref:Uncharacterized protein n=1 Tax=Staphylococcus marylandisciuri TaxID=2981529 RepID=A0ABT2QQQ7_9STAP|nr:hypothetical protein [Staphylococcus marylandisciuri]MCU5746319.1 hypothetical protein [Staphylococcus marylandisciuri]
MKKTTYLLLLGGVSLLLVIELVMMLLNKRINLHTPFNPLHIIITVAVWVVLLIVILAMRAISLRKDQQGASEPEEMRRKLISEKLNLQSNEYFFQTPFYYIGERYVTIYNSDNINMYFRTTFNTQIEKWLSLIGAAMFIGIEVISENHSVKVKRIKYFSYPASYRVILDDHPIGEFRRQKFVSEKGYKKRFGYKLFTDKSEYTLNSPYLTKETTIEKDGKPFYYAKRNFLDVSKNKATKKRGEQQRIKFDDSLQDYPVEVWLAIYTQAIVMLHVEEKASVSTVAT